MRLRLKYEFPTLHPIVCPADGIRDMVMRSVLIIEDDADSRRAIGKLFARADWKVLEAADGDAGIEVAIRNRPEVILCDLLMPKSNGFQVCRTIRQQLQPTKIIVVSGRDYAVDRASALEAGADYCRRYVSELAETRAYALAELSHVEYLCDTPGAEGAFYLLLRVKSSLNAETMAERLVRQFGVAVIPGGTFGLQDGCYLRVSYGALRAETALEGISRLVNGLKELAHG
jgi:CheY-like chemotaxis protein